MTIQLRTDVCLKLGSISEDTEKWADTESVFEQI